MAVRITGNDVPAHWRGWQPSGKNKYPAGRLNISILEQNLQNLYKAENKMSKITIVFSALSILVACLGLFGLSTYTAEERKKEMSIRKVLGGSGMNIFLFV